MFGSFYNGFLYHCFVGFLSRWVFSLVVIHFVCFVGGGRFIICYFLVLPFIEKVLIKNFLVSRKVLVTSSVVSLLEF